jgi:general nucleoside transport system permease protein
LRALLQGPLHEAGQELASEQLPEAARLPHLLVRGMRSELHLGFFIALTAAIVVSVLLRYTTFGFRLRATGENPIAARFSGIRIGRVMVTTLCLSGALAGMAGAVQISGVPSYQLLPDAASSGFGFTGIAVALLGRLSPLGTVLAALFFGWLNVAFAQLEAQLNVPFLTLQAAQGAILVAMLVLTNLKWRPRRVRFSGRNLSARASAPE